MTGTIQHYEPQTPQEFTHLNTDISIMIYIFIAVAVGLIVLASRV